MWNFWNRGESELSRATKAVERLEHRADDLIKQKDKLQVEIESHKQKIEVLQSQLKREISETLQSVNKSNGLQRQMDFTLEAIREQMKVAEDTIETLVQANQTFRDMATAESSHHQLKAMITDARSGSE